MKINVQGFLILVSIVSFQVNFTNATQPCNEQESSWSKDLTEQERKAFLTAHNKSNAEALPEILHACFSYYTIKPCIYDVFKYFFKKDITEVLSNGPTTENNNIVELLPFEKFSRVEARQYCKNIRSTFTDEIEKKYGKNINSINMVDRIAAACAFSNAHFVFNSQKARITFIYSLLEPDYEACFISGYHEVHNQ